MKKNPNGIADRNTLSDEQEPIENYAVIGDLNTVAMISLKGSVDFFCFPDFDSPSIFAAILDKQLGGYFAVSPQNPGYKSKQLYLPETNILLTRFLSEEGIGELTDFMPVQELNRGNELIRRVTTVKGSITYRLICSPRFDYARAKHRVTIRNKYEVEFISGSAGLSLRLKSSVPLDTGGGDAFATFSLAAGEFADFILADESKPLPEQDMLPVFVTESLNENIHFWKNWSELSEYKGRWQQVVNRSSLLLKLLTSCKYGSLVAAPTFGLPEEIGGGRNWDYRYTWIRDGSFTVYCLLNLGYDKEAGRFVEWVRTRCLDPQNQQQLQIVYRLSGETDMNETTLGNLSGYKGSRPVRIGNAAYKQVQLDIYGELMNAVYLFDKHGDPISYEFWLDLSAQLNWMGKNWKQKDDGIWEVRGGKKSFLYSRLMCWVAFDRGIKIALNHSYPVPPDWQQHRDEIFNSIHKEFWNTGLNAFVQYAGSDYVDAASLMMPLMGFIGAKDPKWLSTLDCIEKRLVDDFLVYRYRENNAVDGLQGHEGTFSMCTFWFIECLSMAGYLDKARLYFEKMLGYANHVGLYSEELGFSGEHLGNFPQAFTHLGLISAAISLDKQLDDSRNKRAD